MARRRIYAALVTLGALGAAAAPAAAQSGAPGAAPTIALSPVADGAAIAAALAVTGLGSLWPVDRGAPEPRRELVPFDDAVKDNFSPAAARASDLLLALELVTPLALQAGEGLDAAAGRRSLVYGETIAVSLALNAATKVLVARPRPYLYNPDPRVQAYARRQGRDAHLSFYSGHAATAFAAAVGGGYLFAQSTTDTRARTAAWAAGLMLAGATSNLRVRAGKHFYSDVLVGAALGAGAGLAVPLLHYRGHETNALTSPEWLAIAVAPLAGAALSQIVPLPAAFGESPSPSAHASPPAVVVPWVSGSGGGLALAGRF